MENGSYEVAAEFIQFQPATGRHGRQERRLKGTVSRTDGASD